MKISLAIGVFKIYSRDFCFRKFLENLLAGSFLKSAIIWDIESMSVSILRI